jgi:hypothetical protein
VGPATDRRERAEVERNWGTLGPKLARKLHIYTGDVDSFYLNNAAHLMASSLEKTSNAPYGGEVVFQPLAPHCGQPAAGQRGAWQRGARVVLAITVLLIRCQTRDAAESASSAPGIPHRR